MGIALMFSWILFSIVIGICAKRYNKSFFLWAIISLAISPLGASVVLHFVGSASLKKQNIQQLNVSAAYD